MGIYSEICALNSNRNYNLGAENIGQGFPVLQNVRLYDPNGPFRCLALSVGHMNVAEI